MSQQFIEKLNNQFVNGILPDELNYTEKPEEQLDISKIQYQSFYRTFEYAASKFPPGWESIPGFDKVIESCIPKQSPLEQILELKEGVEEEN